MSAELKTPEPNVVNGINVDDLFALIDDVKREPGKGKTNWHVTTTWQGQARSRAEIESYEIGGEKVPRRFSIDIDEPHELGGSNRFANPQEHLIAALNACMTVGYAAQCAERGITLQSLAIETDGEIDLRGFLGIDPRREFQTAACDLEHVRAREISIAQTQQLRDGAAETVSDERHRRVFADRKSVLVRKAREEREVVSVDRAHDDADRIRICAASDAVSDPHACLPNFFFACRRLPDMNGGPRPQARGLRDKFGGDFFYCA